MRIARHSTAKIFGSNAEESLTLCEQQDLEYSNGVLATMQFPTV